MDLLIIETGNGGDCLLQGNDLAVANGYENMPYLSMFSGEDWWGNDLLLNEGDDFKYNATTERVMKEVALNSSGRIAIEAAMNADLAFFKKYEPDTAIKVSTSIVNADRLDTKIDLVGQAIYFQWNPSIAFLNYKV